jgi:hypothetical protein
VTSIRFWASGLWHFVVLKADMFWSKVRHWCLSTKELTEQVSNLSCRKGRCSRALPGPIGMVNKKVLLEVGRWPNLGIVQMSALPCSWIELSLFLQGVDERLTHPAEREIVLLFHVVWTELSVGSLGRAKSRILYLSPSEMMWHEKTWTTDNAWSTSQLYTISRNL